MWALLRQQTHDCSRSGGVPPRQSVTRAWMPCWFVSLVLFVEYLRIDFLCILLSVFLSCFGHFFQLRQWLSLTLCVENSVVSRLVCRVEVRGDCAVLFLTGLASIVKSSILNWFRKAATFLSFSNDWKGHVIPSKCHEFFGDIFHFMTLDRARFIRHEESVKGM